MSTAFEDESVEEGESIRRRDAMLCAPHFSAGDSAVMRHALLARAIFFLLAGAMWLPPDAAAHARQQACFSDASMAAGVATAYRQILGR